MRRPPDSRRSVLFSIATHAAVIGTLLLVARVHPPTLAPKHLAGTSHGTELMLTYQLAGAPPTAASTRTSATGTRATPAPRAKAPQQKAVQLTAPSTPTPGNASEGSLGDGDMTIALVQFHPHPQPDLSTLPPGTSGDIVLDAVINTQGRIANLTVTRSLGETVDRQVIATVKQWTFTPAMRSGTPIASEQEILIHYERSSTSS